MAYIGAEPDGMGKAQRFTFTASGGETVVSADDDGIPIGYTAGQVSVYLNGVKLVVGTGKDCQATNGSTITGLSALEASDVVEVVALSIFSATTVEGTALISTGETGGSKFLREDGDGTSSWQPVTEYNDNVVQTNIALLAFKTAVNGSLAKYNLQDQVIDEYTDATGVDGTPSTNHVLTSGVYAGRVTGAAGTGISGGDSIDTSVSGYTTRVFTTSRALTVTTSGNVTILVVGGGGSGGNYYSGGGGAGGVVVDNVYALTPNTYDAVIGNGGASQTTWRAAGNDGEDSTFTINGGAVQFTAKGGGGGGYENNIGRTGASSGGNGYSSSTAAVATQNGTQGAGAVDFNLGYVGGIGTGASGGHNPGGGGGAGGVGVAGASSSAASGNGGEGYNGISLFGTALGDGGYFASGGGGGFTENTTGTAAGTAYVGGGGAGSDGTNISEAGQANTGGGSGGGGANSSNNTTSGSGGSGVILVRYANADFAGQVPSNLTLQSTDTEAEAQPTKADMVMLVEDAGSGVGTVNTHIKGFISRDSGTTFTEGVLVDEGDWGTNKRILAFHDLDISSQPADQTMCYKITTHSASAEFDTKIHATSIGWR